MPRKTFRKQITHQSVLEEINPKNLKLRDQFLKEKRTQCSDLTVGGYLSDLNIFFTWNLKENEDKFFVEIKKLEFSEFFSYCSSELKWGTARFSRMRSCLSSLSDFVEKYFDDEYPNFRNIILKIIDTPAKEPSREKTILKKDQIELLLSNLYGSGRLQEACFVAMAVASGARLSEILRITTDIIDFNNVVFKDIFVETTHPIKTKGRTNKGKLIKKYLIRALFEKYYVAWMDERNRIMKENGVVHNHIYIKKNGLPAEIGTVRSWVPRWEKILGVPVYPHAFRHYTVTYLAGLGIPQELVVELMGWTSSEMFNVYNDLSAKDREWEDLAKLKADLN